MRLPRSLVRNTKSGASVPARRHYPSESEHRLGLCWSSDGTNHFRRQKFLARSRMLGLPEEPSKTAPAQRPVVDSNHRLFDASMFDMSNLSPTKQIRQVPRVFCSRPANLGLQRRHHRTEDGMTGTEIVAKPLGGDGMAAAQDRLLPAPARGGRRGVQPLQRQALLDRGSRPAPACHQRRLQRGRRRFIRRVPRVVGRSACGASGGGLPGEAARRVSRRWMRDACSADCLAANLSRPGRALGPIT